MGVRGIVEISRSALRHNLGQIRAHLSPHTEIVAMIKANAYGHGALQVACTLAAEGVRWFGVATLGEAVELRDAGIQGNILLFENAPPSDAAEILARDITPVVRDLELAAALSRAAHNRRLNVHVEVETGMQRSGVTFEQYPQFLAGLRQFQNLRVDGVFSHLACSEEAHSRRTERQLKLFRQFVQVTHALGATPRYFHLANSGGVFLHPAAQFNMVRPGIALYGLCAAAAGLMPALNFRSRIVELRKVKAREQVGYGKTFITHSDTTIATVPIGYGDGYPRALSNRAQALVRGNRAPVVGRVSMDLMTLDVGGCAGVSVGDEVVLVGAQDKERISTMDLAHWAETIPYEIVTRLSVRLPRTVVE
jgi:alanine racemase